jgi:hypothetical protein
LKVTNGKNMNYLISLPALLAFFLAACTSVQVRPLEPKLSVSKICIEENEKVIVPQFLEIVRSGFDRHGISTEVFTSTPPTSCSVVLTYTALRHWDFVPFLSHAELWLRDQKGKQVGYAEYHLTGGGGLDFSKWASTESKMNPVIDQLLSGYK